MAKRKKILVVDDELFFREILRDSLEDRYEVITGKNGHDAISLAYEKRPDLIIMDVEMPDKTGIEACKELKKTPETRVIPIVLLTSRANKEDIIHGLKVGADDYILKPICLPEIVARIDAHLRTKDFFTELEYKDLLLLLELTEAISATRNPLMILRLIVEKMSDVIDVARCSIVSLNDKDELVVKASNDMPASNELKLDLDKYPEIREALKTKQAVIINNVKDDPLLDSVRHDVTSLNYNSIVVIPVIKKESVIGTFFLRTATPLKDGITDRVYKLCQLVANISANALENAILFESMKSAQEFFEEMAIRDGLTKLYNHQYFYSRLEEEFSRAERYKGSLAVIFFDIDDFKRVNDKYGHINGDKVLRQLGQIVKEIARESDIVARYGGEEFAVILPNTEVAGAMEMAHRLRVQIREHSFNFLDGDQITISTGVSVFADNNLLSFDQLMQHADEALYKAKSQGKDRVIQA